MNEGHSLLTGKTVKLVKKLKVKSSKSATPSVFAGEILSPGPYAWHPWSPESDLNIVFDDWLLKHFGKNPNMFTIFLHSSLKCQYFVWN